MLLDIWSDDLAARPLGLHRPWTRSHLPSPPLHFIIDFFMLLEAYHKAQETIWDALRRVRPHSAYVLPTELWIMIIDHVTSIPISLGTECSPSTFYFFATTHRAWSTAISSTSYKEQCKTLRAVCRTWRDITDSQKKKWLHLSSNSLIWDIPPEAWRVNILLDTAHKGGSGKAQIDGIGFSNTRILALYGFHTLPNISDTPSHLAPFMKVLNTVRPSSSSIQSLIYEDNVRLGSEDLSIIIITFPSLTALTLHASEIRGALSIPSLQVLNISASSLDISQWSLPSLKHLALGDQSGTSLHISYSTLNLPQIKDQLQSLLLLPPYWVRLFPAFWNDHPLLEFLGVYDLHLASGEFTHEARILCITGPRIGHYSDPQIGIYNQLPLFPSLRTLITPELQLQTQPPTSGYSLLWQYCKENHVAWKTSYEESAERPMQQFAIGTNIVWRCPCLTYDENT